jgi:hypothetical protein
LGKNERIKNEGNDEIEQSRIAQTKCRHNDILSGHYCDEGRDKLKATLVGKAESNPSGKS